jgi:hypothetical protein
MQEIVMDNFDNVWEFYEACIERGVAPIENYADPIEPYIPYINIGEELPHEEVYKSDREGF